MPHPLAHPAAAIPFRKLGFVFSALVFGSISPDFGYVVLHIHYFMTRLTPFFMNTTFGLLIFDVPVALALLWLFHTFVKWPLLSLLPESLQRCLFKHAQGFSFKPPKRLALILLSVTVGSLTHVIWDSFTHEHGWTVEHFTVLRISINGIPVYTILQNLGTILGISILIYWTIKWLRVAPQSDQLPWNFPGKVRTIFLALAMAPLVIVESVIIYPRLMSGTRLIGEHFLMDSAIVLAVLIISSFMGTYCVVWMIISKQTTRFTAFSRNIEQGHGRK